MYSKCALLVALVAAIALASYTPTHAYSHYGFNTYAANNTNKSHHLIAGSRLPGDRLTYQENIIKSSSWLQIVTVQKTFNASRGEKITQVLALDQKTNGNGAYAKIVSGGPGLNNVTIKFKSQRSHGINFVVQVYSRP